MKQLSFDFIEQFSQEKIHLEEKINEELISSMAEPITEIVKNEREKTDANLSE